MATPSITLKFVTGPLKGQTFKYQGKNDLEVYMGKASNCDLIIKDPKASGEHCGLFFENGHYIIEDFDSTNGTYINTTKITGEVSIKNGDTLFVGSSRVQVVIETPKSSVKTTKPIAPITQKNNNASNRLPDDIDDIDDDDDVKKLKQMASPLSIDFYLDLKENFSALPMQKKAIFISGFAIVLFLIIFVATLPEKNAEGFSTNTPNRSEEIFSLSESIEELKGYLNLNGNILAAENPFKVRYKFDYEERTKITLLYKVAKIEFFDEVVIKLNNVEIGKVPIVQQGILNAKISLPIQGLKAKDNLLEFINTKSTKKLKEQWGIQPTKIDIDILPSPDFEKAKQSYSIAEKYFDQKQINRGNRYKAYQQYNQAIKFMELMIQKPPLYTDCLKKITLVNQELDEINSKALYMTKRNIDFQKYKEAKIYLRKIMEEIPDINDARYQNAAQFLEALQ